ncbi:hypothetical protein EDB86DRAFT_2970961, partial [Lactarius hatsudake]
MHHIQKEHSAPAPRLAVLDSSPGIAAALAPSRPLRPVTLCIANTLYDSLRPVALFGALIGTLKGLILLLGALGNIDVGLETSELSLEGILDEVLLKTLYKQVGSLLQNVQVLCMLRLRTMTTTASQVEEGLLHLALQIRPPLGSALSHVSCFLQGRNGNSIGGSDTGEPNSCA